MLVVVVLSDTIIVPVLRVQPGSYINNSFLFTTFFFSCPSVPCPFFPLLLFLYAPPVSLNVLKWCPARARVNEVPTKRKRALIGRSKKKEFDTCFFVLSLAWMRRFFVFLPDQRSISSRCIFVKNVWGLCRLEMIPPSRIANKPEATTRPQPPSTASTNAH